MFLVLAPLHWIGCAPHNIFFGIFVRDRHFTPVVLGLALATGVVAEMVVLLKSLFVTSMLGVGNVAGYLATGWVYDSSGRVDPAFFPAAALEVVPLTLALGAQRRRLAGQRRVGRAPGGRSTLDSSERGRSMPG